MCGWVDEWVGRLACALRCARFGLRRCEAGSPFTGAEQLALISVLTGSDVFPPRSCLRRAEPACTPASTVPPDYLARVKEVHEKGGYGSIG